MVQNFWTKKIVWRCRDCSREHISEFHHTNEKICGDTEYAMVCTNSTDHIDNITNVEMRSVDWWFDEVYVTDPRDVRLINKQTFVPDDRAFPPHNYY